MPLDGGYVNQFGEFVIEDNSSAASVVFGLYDTLKGVFVHSTRFMKDIMTNLRREASSFSTLSIFIHFNIPQE